MIRPPAFWQDGTRRLLPGLLRPFAKGVAAYTARRVAGAGWRAPVPVICCGNAGVGGAGKTTVALSLGGILLARGVGVHFLIRGHGGSIRTVCRVDPARHAAGEVGDEALLLAALAPTWIGADRAASARAAVAAGAQALVMDDGLQNPTLVKTLSLLVIDGAAGFGNGLVMPAGPLREPVPAAAARATAAVLIGSDPAGALAQLPPGICVLRADLAPAPTISALGGRRVLAFAGIGRPEKFFHMLEAAGIELAGRAAFPDHHRFSPRDMQTLRCRARDLDAVLATTPKDAVRLGAPAGDIVVVGVDLVWQDRPRLLALLADSGL